MDYLKIILTFIFLFIVNFANSQDLNENYINGKVAFNKKQFIECSFYLSKAIEEGVYNHDIFLTRGMSYYYTQRCDSAIADFLKIEKIKPGSGYYLISKSYSIKEDITNSIKYLKFAISNNQYLTLYDIDSDTIFKNLSTTREWNIFFKDINFSDFQNKLKDIKYHIEISNYKEALSAINDLIWDNLNDQFLHFIRGNIYLNLNDTLNAIDDFKIAFALDPANFDILFYYSTQLKKQKKYKKASEIFEKFIYINPYEIAIYKEIADVEYQLKHFENSSKNLAIYLSYYSDNEAIFNCGLSYFGSGNILEALKCFNKLIAQDRSKSEYFIARGNTLLKSKTYKNAESDFAMALDIDPLCAEAYFKRGLARYYLGEIEKAKIDWGKAYNLGFLEAGQFLINK